MSFKSYKQESRVNWGRDLSADQQISEQQIQLGAILRIADATEAMAKNHVELQDEAKRLSSRVAHLVGQMRLADYRERNLKGQVTKLKKLLEVKNLLR